MLLIECSQNSFWISRLSRKEEFLRKLNEEQTKKESKLTKNPSQKSINYGQNKLAWVFNYHFTPWMSSTTHVWEFTM